MPDAALFSLSDKTGAAEIAKALVERGTIIYATGGTRTFLAGHGIDARDVEDLTGFPPLFDGRVKTLHPKVFGAILYDRGKDGHRAEARQYAIADLKTVVVNLYPFEATVAKKGHGACRGDRADRHRRCLAAARCGKELRPRQRAEPPLAIRRVFGRAAKGWTG